MSSIQIALKFNENYSAHSYLLLEEMNKEIHFRPIKLGIKSAWTIAVVLAENLKERDYKRLKSKFDKWDRDEKSGLLEWLASHPEQANILKNGTL